MNSIDEKSFVMAERLKKLRESKFGKLSHAKLSTELIKKYRIKISPDSLMNYEVTDPNHTKAGKNQGMRVEYLRCLADFYGVSTDYLSGISEVKTSNTDVISIVDQTGLSEQSVYRIVRANLYGRSLSDLGYRACNAEALHNIKGHLVKDPGFGDAGDFPLLIADNCVQYTNFLDDIIAIAAQSDRLLGNYRNLVNASISEFQCVQPLDGTTDGNVMENGMKAIPNDEYIRYMAAEIAKEIDRCIVEKYLSGPKSNKESAK